MADNNENTGNESTATESSEPTITLSVLNHHGDEERTLLLNEARGVLRDFQSRGMWVFDDKDNTMVSDADMESHWEEGGSATVMPASVGG